MQPNLGPLAGYRTLIVALCLGAATVMQSLGYIDDATFTTIRTLLEGAGLVTLRAAITNHGAPSEK